MKSISQIKHKILHRLKIFVLMISDTENFFNALMSTPILENICVSLAIITLNKGLPQEQLTI